MREVVMGRSRHFRRSNLFLIRLWTEQQGNGDAEWCGRVQRTANGESHEFSTWPELVTLLLAMAELEPGAPRPDSSKIVISPGERP
jgi:hypothetical protein